MQAHNPPNNRFWYDEGFKDGQKALAKKAIFATITIGALLLISGCMSMPDVKVEGVDNLKVTEHVVSTQEVSKICGEKLGIPRFMRFLYKIWGCAEIELKTWTCDIYYSEENLEGQEDLLDHERLHCKGYWHDDGLQLYYDEWRKENGK